MKILKLTSENVKKLKVVEITPDGNIVVISGANAAGKTSVLDSIWMALAGKDAMKSNPDVIRHGENDAKVIVNLGSEDEDQEELIVTRTWTKGKTHLKIENGKGAKFQSPQTMLDKLTGKLSFDPLAFSQLPEKEQLKTLLDLTDISDDLVDLDGQRKELYDERTIVNRELKQLEGQHNGIPDMVDVPDDEISSVDVMNDMQVATEQITENNNKRTDLSHQIEGRAATAAQLSYLNGEILRLQDEAESYKIKLATEDHTIADMKATVESLVNPDLEQFKCKLADVEQINAQVRKKQELNQIVLNLEDVKSISQKITQDIQDIDDLKDELWSEANHPIDGLGFDDNGITYNQVPFSQCSAAERLRVSMSMAMAMNPEVRVIRITDGSLLDSANMELIEQMAIDNDFQVWLEVVQEDGTLGVYIEEGEVAHDNYKCKN